MSSEIDMNKMIADLQRLAAQAQAKSPVNPVQTGPGDFSSLFKQAVDGVNGMQQQASKLRKAFELGEPGVDLPQVMVAAQKSSVAFSAMMQVRNKLIEAYKEVMSMPI